VATLEVDLDLDTDKAKKKTIRDTQQIGKQSAASFAAGFKANIGLITAAIAGVAAFAKSIDFFKDSIRAAAVQQQAIQDLNTQLAVTGQFTEAISQDLQNFARQIQETTRFGDEAILSQIAFAQALGATAEQSKAIVAAGADLAESLNIDLNSAVRNVGKTLGGYAGELGEVIPELKGLTQEQLRAGAAIDILAEKFAGAAQGRVRTFAGATAQLSNTFGDFQEAIGRVVTNSPAFIAVINTTSKLIADFSKSLSGAADNDPFGQLLLGAISLARTANEFLIPPFQRFFGFINTGVNVAKTLIQGLIAAVATGVNAVVELGAKIPGALGEPFRQISEQVRIAKETTDQVLGELVDETLNELVTEEQTQAFTARINTILDKYQQAINAARSFRGETQISFKRTKDAVAQEVAGLNNVIKNGLVNTLSVAFQDVGKILAGAGNGFKGFVGIVLNALGDLAISIGTTVIGSAIAIDALKKSLVGSPFAAVALGGALIAAGAALKTFAGSLGGGSTPAPSVGGFGSAAGEGIQTDDQFTQTTPEERENPEARVQLTVNGNIFDSEETGLRLASILEKTIRDENVRIVGSIA
jgi:hypothetical protein